MSKPYMPCVARPIELGNKKKTPRLLKKSPQKCPSKRKNFLLQSFQSQLRSKQENKGKKIDPESVWNQNVVEDVEILTKRKKKFKKTQEEIEEAKIEIDLFGSGAEEEDLEVSDSEDTESDSSESEDDGVKDRKDENNDREEVVEEQLPHIPAIPGDGWANDLEKQAMDEIIRESKRAGEMAKETGVWLKPAVPSTNKRFLRNMLASTLSRPLNQRKRPIKRGRDNDWYMKPQNDFGDQLWEDRQKRSQEIQQRKEEEWRDYKNSSYFGRSKHYSRYERIRGAKTESSAPNEAKTREPSEREKYEHYKKTHKRLKDEYENEYEQLKKRFTDAGHKYAYGREKWREDSVHDGGHSANKDFESDHDDYLDFRDVLASPAKKSEVKRKKEKSKKKKSHKHKKHSKRK